MVRDPPPPPRFPSMRVTPASRTVTICRSCAEGWRPGRGPAGTGGTSQVPRPGSGSLPGCGRCKKSGLVCGAGRGWGRAGGGPAAGPKGRARVFQALGTGAPPPAPWGWERPADAAPAPAGTQWVPNKCFPSTKVQTLGEHDAKIGADRCRRNPSPRVPYPGGKQRCPTDRQTRGRGRRRRAAGWERGASWPEAGCRPTSQRRGHAHTAARQPHHCTGGAAF